MSTPEFTIDLGNGVQIDSNGVIRTGPIPEKPVFKAKSGLPVKPDTIKNVLDGIKKALPSDENKDVAEKLQKLGVAASTIALLGKIAKIAGVLSGVAGAAAIAIDVLKFLDVIGPEQDQLKEYLKGEFEKLNTRSKNGDKKAQLNDAAGKTAAYQHALQKVKSYHEQLGNPFLTDQLTIANLLQDIRTQQSALSLPLLTLLKEPWVFTFEATEYSSYGGRLYNRLYSFKDPSTPQICNLPENLALAFDHRPCIGVLAYGLQSYLTLIKIMAPEFRTTGEFAGEMRSLADELDNKLDLMRELCVARTIYKEGDTIPIAGALPAHLRPLIPGMPVGAFDLREYTDAVITAEINKPEAGAEQRAGTMLWNWTPPAGTKPGYYDAYGGWYTLSAEIAAGANNVSEKEYMDLLVSSGYTTLMHFAATLRHLATEPNQSQTVVAKVSESRSMTESKEVPVTSGPIPLSNPVASTGTQESYDVQIWARFSTQRLKRQFPIGYRISLRTLPMGTVTAYEHPYSNYWWTEYRPADIPGSQEVDPKNQELKVHISGGKVDEEELLTGVSPQTTVNVPLQTKDLLAYTFDYWVPIPDSPYVTEWDPDLAEIISYGWKPPSQKKMLMKPLLDPNYSMLVTSGPGDNLLDTIIAAGVNNTIPDGLIRDVRLDSDKPVRIQYTVSWTADRLLVTIKNRPSDRNYIIYIVVEERLKSGQWLHTAVRCPIFGQLTFVSQGFLNAEAEARNRVNKMFTEFERKYAISVQPGPMDPVIGWIRPGEMSFEELNRLHRLAEEHAPELLRSVIREHESASLRVAEA